MRANPADAATTATPTAGPLRREPSQPRIWALVLGLGLFGLLLFTVRLSLPPRFGGNEWRLSAYVLDVVDNGRWFSQTDTLGEPASKPPLLMWLSALASLPSGRVGPLALYAPTAAATIAIAWLLLAVGRARFGWRAGFLAAATYLLSYVAVDQMHTTRYDGALAFLVALGALAAWRGWRTGAGWTWFWTASALGTLTKGPLAVVLSAAGLLAGLWERGPSRSLRGPHRLGLALYVAITGAWLGLAYLDAGSSLVEKMFGAELVGHAIGGVGHVPALQLSQAYKPAWTLAMTYAPWSLLTLAGAFQVVARPAGDPEQRAFERFVLFWLLVDLLIFCAAAHHRARLIYPVVPPAALLAGRELDRWTRRLRSTVLLSAACAAAVAVLVFVAHPRFAGRADRAERGTVEAGALAQRLRALGPGEFPLTYVDPEGPLQVWLSTRHVAASADQAWRLLAGPAAAFVVVESGSWASRVLEGRAVEVFRWPATDRPQGRILSNHPRLEWPDRTAIILDGVRVEMDRARLLRATGAEMAFRVEPQGAVSVVSEAVAPRTVRVRLVRVGSADLVAERRLAPGEAWRPGAR